MYNFNKNYNTWNGEGWPVHRKKKSANINCIEKSHNAVFSTQKCQSSGHKCVQKLNEIMFKELKRSMITYSSKNNLLIK